MSAIYFSIGGLVFAIGIFNRDLLVRKESFRIILGVSVVLFLAGLIIHFTTPARYFGSGALLAPLLSLALFHLFHFFHRLDPCCNQFCRNVDLQRQLQSG